MTTFAPVIFIHRVKIKIVGGELKCVQFSSFLQFLSNSCPIFRTAILQLASFSVKMCLIDA